jgi:hypothetical protein
MAYLHIQNTSFLRDQRPERAGNFATLTVDLHSAANVTLCAAATASVLLSAMQSEH